MGRSFIVLSRPRAWAIPRALANSACWTKFPTRTEQPGTFGCRIGSAFIGRAVLKMESMLCRFSPAGRDSGLVISERQSPSDVWCLASTRLMNFITGRKSARRWRFNDNQSGNITTWQTSLSLDISTQIWLSVRRAFLRRATKLDIAAGQDSTINYARTNNQSAPFGALLF